MAVKAKKSSRWIRLNSEDRDVRVFVSPEDGDRFAIPMELAVRGCKIASQLHKFNEQYNVLLSRLADWTRKHGDDIEKVHLGLKNEGLLFLVVRKGKLYNRDLEDALTVLDLEIAQDDDFDTIELSVLSIPKATEATIRSFLPQRGTLVYRNAK